MQVRGVMAAVKVIAAVCVSAARAELNFLVMGDWGGLEGPIYSTPGEHATARAMGHEATKIDAAFALTVGDNFYFHGVTDEHDKRFKRTFEDVFKADSLQSPDFFRVIAGNHDHRGNVSAQIAYTEHSEKWHFPSLWYSWADQVDETGTTAEFVMLDTIVLSGPSACPATGEEWLGSDERMDEHRDVGAAQTQYEWLEATLAASTADFIFVSGHYPVWSVCEHGPTTRLVDTLKPLLEKYGVAAYFAGHDHCQEHIDDNGGVQYHVVGAANANQGSHKCKDKVPEEHVKFLDLGTPFLVHELEGGFSSVTIASKEAGAIVNHFRSSSVDPFGYHVKYTAEAIPARSSPTSVV